MVTLNVKRVVGDSMDIADRIEELKANRWPQVAYFINPTQTEVAKALGVSQTVLNRWLNRKRGKRGLPMRFVSRAADKIKTSVDWLIYRQYVLNGINLTRFEELLREKQRLIDGIFAEIEDDPRWGNLSTLERLALALLAYEANQGEGFRNNIRRTLQAIKPAVSRTRKRG